MKKTVLILSFLFTCFSAFTQVSIVESLEFESKYFEEDYQTILLENQLVGFRVSKNNSSPLLQIITADNDLKGNKLYQIPISKEMKVVNYDVDEENLHILLQPISKNNLNNFIIYKVNLKNQEIREFPVSGIIDQVLMKFKIINNNAIFVGLVDETPSVQILNMKSNRVETLPARFFINTKILQFQGNTSEDLLDILISRKNKRSNNQVSLITLDFEGNLVKEITLENLRDNKEQYLEANLLSMENENQVLAGSVGDRKKNVRTGIFLNIYNEFGEIEKNQIIGLENLKTSYDFLPQKEKDKKIKNIEKLINRNKTPSFDYGIVVRNIIETERGNLLYLESYTVEGGNQFTDYGFTDGFNVNSMGAINPFNEKRTYIETASKHLNRNTTLVNGNFKFHGGHFVLINNDGDIKWDQTFSLVESVKILPSQLGHFHLDESKNEIYHLMLKNGILTLNSIKNGQTEIENQRLSILPSNGIDEVVKVKHGSEKLMHWYDNYYLVTSKEIIRSTNQNGTDDYREVFSISKIEVKPE